jgi:ESCRT-I complex subunit TSG101
MSGAESLTQKWLRQNVHLYPHKDRVYSDVDAVLSRFPTLRPKTDVYSSVTPNFHCIFDWNVVYYCHTPAYDDGRTQLLLCVHGLLPISFRHASYHIPVAIWLNRDYPQQPPIAYVVPTNDMLVKPGKFLDISGRCNPEYLSHWERKSEVCSMAVTSMLLRVN